MFSWRDAPKEKDEENFLKERAREHEEGKRNY